jgi:GNAT superfamily N-acetyltransferase
VIFSDLELARRLERAEGAACASFVEARARVMPESGAAWIDVNGAWAMFDGVDSPSTQSFGLGLFEPATDASLATIEQFFRERGSLSFHEVSPLAGKETALLLSAKGYEPYEFTSVMNLPLSDRRAMTDKTNRNFSIRIAKQQDADIWIATSVRGWCEFPEYAGMLHDLARIGLDREDSVSFLVEQDGKPIATAAVAIHKGVALMAGASTVPEARGQGAQRALLAARLEHAASVGCDLAMMGAEPGSASQRNAERVGFRIAYTRLKWRPRARS